MNKSLKNLLLLISSILKYIYYLIANPSLRMIPIKDESHTLALVMLGELGDFILFRTLFKYIRESDKYIDYDITLIGNAIWKELFDYLDSDFVDQTIWINKQNFSKNLTYRKSKLNSIIIKSYEQVINCAISRDFYFDDTIVKVINAKIKTGCMTDLSNQYLWQIKKSDKYYTQLIRLKESELFELDKYCSYIGAVLKTEINNLTTSIEKKPNDQNFKIYSNAVALCLGGRRKYKIWNFKNFSIVIKHIIKKYDFKIVILGTFSDVKYSLKLKKLLPQEKLIDLTSKTSLIDILGILSNVKMLISNDTGIAHISAALKTKTMVLLNGTHLGRFFPYPERFVHVESLYPQIISDNINNPEFSQGFKYRSYLDINSISPFKLIEKVDNYFTKN